jgi:coenzyme F420-reducing hydrogenase gamma subunit
MEQNAEIEKAIKSEADKFNFDFVQLAEYKVEGCTSCHLYLIMIDSKKYLIR